MVVVTVVLETGMTFTTESTGFLRLTILGKMSTYTYTTEMGIFHDFPPLLD